MKEKIMNIKNILRIIISLFVIFSMIKSCAKAYTFSDFSNFVDQVQGQSTNSSYVNEIVNAFKGSKNAILTLLANNGKSPSDYTYFAIRRANNSATYDFYLATNDIVTFLPSGNYGVVKYDPYGISIRLTYNNNQGWQATNTTWSNRWISNIPCGAFIGLNNTANYAGDSWQRSGYNKVYWWVVGNYNPITYLEYNNTVTENTHNGSLFTYYYQGNLYGQNELKLGDITINDSYYYEVRLRNSNTNVVVGTIFYDVNTNNTYNDGAIYQDNNKNIYVTTRLLNYSTQYQLEVESYYGDGGTNLYEDIDWYIFLPSNAVISGDSIQDLGNGEFTTQDSTNQIIDNQNQNQNWLEQTYNNLFVMESGDVEDLVENMKANLQISNIGDLSGEKAILETLTGEPSDFIIAWNSTQYMGKTIIPSGEINFSQKVREVPALQTTQNWIRIIMGYSISVVLLSEIFFTILKVLGVSVSIYDQHNEEIERLEEMHTPKVYDTEVITPKGVKRYRTRRTRIQ